MATDREGNYFNTSHVNVNRYKWRSKAICKAYFNTSHVNVNLLLPPYRSRTLSDFNTSHVNVNLNNELQNIYNNYHFNTSHVNVNRKVHVLRAAGNAISIHPMLMLIGRISDNLFSSIIISIHLMLMLISIGNCAGGAGY